MRLIVQGEGPESRSNSPAEWCYSAAMITVIFVEADGTVMNCQGEVGQTLMECAVGAGVTGIIARCGGGLSCLTCHCYPSGEKVVALPEPGADELEVLPFVNGYRADSRMACQIQLSAEMDGIEVRLPESQLNDDLIED